MKNKIKKIVGILIMLFHLIVVKATAQTILLQGDFTGNVLPLGWFEDSLGFTPVVNKWKFTGLPGGVTGAGFDSNYVYISKSPNDTVDCSLVTSIFDASSVTSVYLSYGDIFTFPYQGTEGKVEVSNDGGTSWQIAFTYLSSHGYLPNAFRNVIDITSYCQGSSNARIRFHFFSYKFDYWAIDSIVVSDYEPCTSPTDSMGVTINDRSFCCTGSPLHLGTASLSKGVGQTYQWQKSISGSVYSDIPGAIYDTLTYMQNGSKYYRCEVTCGGVTKVTGELFVPDSPNVKTQIWSQEHVGICSGRDDTLTLLSEKNIPGVVYQWQSSPVSWNFTDIPGATDTMYIVSASNYTADTYFNCLDICATNGIAHSAYSPILDHINANPYCYCYPFNINECPPSGSSFTGTIRKVEIIATPLLNLTSNCNNVMGFNNNYTYFAPAGNTTALLSRNTTYTISVTNDTLSPLIFAMWMDYNSNGIFDTTEANFIFYNAPPGATVSANFTVPSNAVPGLTGMRVRSYTNFGGYKPTDGCSYRYGGETEDYMVTIDTTVSISSEQGVQSSEFSVYPNPATKELTISSGSMQQGGSIYIQNMLGETVYTHHSPLTTYQTTFNIAALPPGIYFVKLQTASGAAVKKFVKQ